MNKLISKGEQEFLGQVIKVIEGGFGENKRILFDTQIAQIHDMKDSEVRKSINRLIKRGRFIENVDYIDIIQCGKEFTTFDLLDFYSKQALAQAKNIFVLSERGYTKLIKSMDDDKSWDVMEEVVDNYFTMREIINSQEQLKKDLIYEIYKGGENSIEAHKQLTQIEVEEAVKPLQDRIEEQLNPAIELMGDFIDEDGAWDIEMFAKVLNIKDMGRNNMFKWLREQKILQGDNKPYQSYMKYFKVIPLKNKFAESKTLVNYQGVIFLYRRLKEQGKISLKSVDEVLKELNLSK